MATKSPFLKIGFYKNPLISVLVLLSLSIGHSQPANSPWPMYRHDPQHTGKSPFPGPEVPTPLWTFSAKSWIQSSVALGLDGTLYFGSSNYQFYALHRDGSFKWSFTTDDYIDASPAIGADGTVYISSIDDYLYALHPDGTLKWKFKTGGDLWLSPAIAPDGTIYIGSDDKNVYAIRPNGSQKWKFATDGKIGSSPAIASDGTVYVGSQDNNLYAIHSNGTLKWATTLDDRIFSSPAIATDGTIYIGCDDGRLYAIDPDGRIKWSYLTGGEIASCPGIATDGTVYVGSLDHQLYALRSNGTLKWKFTTEDVIWGSSPAIDANGVIYIGSFDKKLYAINPNGTLKWEIETNDGIYASPAIGNDGTIYIGSKDGKLYAIGNLTSTLITGSFVIAEWYTGFRSGFQNLLYEMESLSFTTVIFLSIGSVSCDGTAERTLSDDAIGWMLDDAANRGMDVYIGMYNSEMIVPTCEFWKEPQKSVIIDESVKAVQEIERRYGSHSSLRGYYVVQEANVGQHIIPIINEFYTPFITQIHKVAPHKNVIAGGYLLQRDVSVNQLNDWIIEFKTNGLDIFLLQDGVGSFDNSMTSYPTIYNHLVAARQAASPVPLWVVVEVFQWSAIGSNTHAETSNDNWLRPGNIIRINQQIYYANVAGAAEKISWIHQRHMTSAAKETYTAFGQEAEHLYRGYKALYFTDSYYFNPAYSCNPQPSSFYPDKGGMLFDRREGQSEISDWVGFEQSAKSKTTITIDLGNIKPVSDVTVVARTETESDIYYPKTMSVQVSTDGANFSWLGSMTNPYQNNNDYSKACFWISAAAAQPARYVRIELTHGGQWLFLTEMEIYHETGKPVPVTFASFVCDVSENSAILHWITATETNNLGFEIERSLDRTSFVKIGFVAGNNTAASPNQYQFTDSDLAAGTYYYRLKQIDSDGSFEYSEILQAVLGTPKTYHLSQNYPNPFNPETTISYQLPEPALVKLEIYNRLGQRVVTLVSQEQPAGFYKVKWDGKNDSQIPLPSGIYFLRLITDDFSATKKLVRMQ